jgi:hypothetical protein
MTSSSKRGICVPWNFEPGDFTLYQKAIDDGTISWLSNWEMWKPKGLPSNIIYIPQCRTANEAPQINDYLKVYESDSQVSGFLGFNEPDIDSQANLSAEKAVELWRQHVLPLKQTYPDLKVGSPAVSNGPGGIPWLTRFFDCLGGVQHSGVDHVAIHYYSPDVEHFKRYLTEAHRTFGLPVWVTEFACTQWDTSNPYSEAEVCSFMREAIGFLDNAGFVERYAWFGAMADVGEGVGRANGLQKTGKLSRAGGVYCLGTPNQ